VAEPEAEKAIVARLIEEPGVTADTGRAGPSGWTASTVVGGGPGADPSSIVFQRTRMLPTCQMHQVSFTNHRGRPMELVIRTWQDPDGTWVVAPVGGGWRGPSHRTKPWVNFTAGFGVHGFTAGGNVEGLGSEQAHLVRLTFADGFTTEDTAEHGIVLYFEPRSVTFPADVHIFDSRGVLLVAYREFDQMPFL
jgi:hypothetical protein